MWNVLRIICLSFYGVAQAGGIGSITMADGQSYAVLQIGNEGTRPDYFVRADKRFFSITRVRQIARVGVGLLHSPSFEIFLDDGHRVRADVGTMWYQRSSFKDPGTGESHYNYSAVMKERGSFGLLLTVDFNGTPRAIELADPNAFLDLVLEPPNEDI